MGRQYSKYNTTGYKSQNVDFKTLFSLGNTSAYTGMTINSPVAKSDIGLGGTDAVTTMNTKQGCLQNTDNVFDVAIEGDGFFRVKGKIKKIFIQELEIL